MKAKELKQDKKNYRKHSDENKRKIKKSIDEAGFGRSVVIDADGVLVCGNGVQSVIDGNTPVKVVETDGTELVVVKRTDLHEGDDRRKLLALADNATADNVEWDIEMLQEEWDDATLEEWVDSVEWKEEADVSPDDFGDEFSLPEGDKSPFSRYGFMLAQEQLEEVTNALKIAKNDPAFEYVETFGNTNGNGNALYLIVKQWEEQKRLS